MAPRELEQRVETARRFNRFYTRQIGVLREGAYKSPFSLTEVRVLYELAHRDRPTATALGRDLGLDAGYLSRILRGFERRGLVLKTRSPADGRQSHLSLTAQGRKVFAPLNARSHDEVAALLGALSPAAHARAVGAMQIIERLLGDRAERPPAYHLRPLQPGDRAWVGPRYPPGERVRAVCPSDGLPQDDALDPERARRRPPTVRGGRLPRRAPGEEPQLREGSGLRDVGAGLVTWSGRFKDHFSEI